MSQQPSLPPREEDLLSSVRLEHGSAQCQCGLFQGCGPPLHEFVSNADTPAPTNPLYPPQGPVENHHLPQYLDFFDFNDAAAICPGPNRIGTPCSMSDPARGEHRYDPRLFGVAPPFGPPATVAAHPNSDHNLTDFQATVPWSHWPASATTIDESAAVLSPATHFGSMPTGPGISNFEPMVAAYETHQLTPTREAPKLSSLSSSSLRSSPSSGSVAALSRSSSHHIQLSPTGSIIQPVQPDALFETVPAPASAPAPLSRTRKNPPAARPMAGQLWSQRRKSSGGKTKQDGRTTTATTSEIRNTSSEYPALPPKNSAVIVADAEGPEASVTSLHSRAQPGSSLMSLEPITSRPKPVTSGAYKQQDGPPPSTASQRQRNRAAATKCRHKSKLAIAELEATERAMSSQHMELSATAMGLRDEVLTLKNELLLHGNCDCEIIQHYLTNAARNIGGAITTAGTGQNHPGQQAGSGVWSSTSPPPPPGPGPHTT